MLQKIKWETVEKWDTPRVFWDEAGTRYTIDNAGTTWIDDSDVMAGNFDGHDGAFAYANDNNGTSYIIFWDRIDNEKPCYDDETDTENVDWDNADITETGETA